MGVEENAVCACNEGFLLQADKKSCEKPVVKVHPCYKGDNAGCSQVCEEDGDNAVCSCYNGFVLQADKKSCEKPVVHPCDKDDNGGCSQVCNKVKENAVCACNEGFLLQADEKSCEKPVVHPCDTGNGGCQQVCEKRKNEAVCSCNAGFFLQADKKSCKKPEWGPWTEYGKCDAECGGGKQGRSRKCTIPDKCEGVDIEIQHCNKQPCPEWKPWGEWGECSKKCGIEGMKRRSRTCTVDGKCDHLGDATEAAPCNRKPCPKWKEWSYWSSCSMTCGSGEQIRNRECTEKDACDGNAMEYRSCQKHECDKVVRCPKDMTYFDAKNFCASKGMKLPRPDNMAENEQMTKLGATWMKVIVNEIFGLDERFENWKGRQRGFLCPDGKWQVLGPMDTRPCHCVKDEADNTQCKDVFVNNPGLLSIKNGEWQFKQDDRSYYGPFHRAQLEEIQLGSKLQYKCKGKKQCRGFVCVRTGGGNSAFVRCKGPNCKNWFNRKPYDFNRCNLACASGYRTLKCY